MDTNVTDLNDLLDGITADAADALTSAQEPVAEPPAPSSDVGQAPPSDTPAAAGASASGSDDQTASQTGADQSSEPAAPAAQTSPWESDENPYRQQAQQSAAFINALHQQAIQQRMAQEIAARDQLLAELPNMDPDQARTVMAQLIAWERQQARQQQQQLVSQYEPYAREVAISRMANRFSLTRDEIAELQQFDGDPVMMERYAQQISGRRRQYEEQTKQLRSQLDALNARISAQQRMASPADRVASGGHTAINDIESLDDLLNGLDLPVWR